MAILTSLLTFLAMIAAGAATVAVLVGPRSPEAARSEGDLRGVAWWLVAFGWGLGVVPLASFWAAVLLDIPLTKSLLVAVAFCNLVGATLFAAGRRGRHPRVDALARVREAARDVASDPRPVLGAFVVATLYLFFFDSRQSPDVSCIYHAALIARGHVQEAADLLLANPDDARLGNSALLAAAAALHGPLGFRFAYAACGFLVALGGFEIGSRAAGRAWGWFGLVFLSLNSYVLAIRLPDENLFALAAGCTVLALLAAREVRTSEWVVAGVLFGLLFTIRHVMVLSLGAPILAALRQRNRALALTAFAGAFAITTSTEHLHHYLAFGSLFRFESNPQFPALPYEFLGIPFRWQGLMNWPLHDHVVRTPFNPFPTFVLWPLAIARHLGLIGFIALHAGVVSLWLRDRREAAFWSLWALPVVAALAVQEAWDQANKMGVILVVSQAAVLWVAACWKEARRRPVTAIVVVAGLAVACALGVRALRDWRAPPDERYLCLTGAGVEQPATLDRTAVDATEVGFLPRLPVPPHVNWSFLSDNARVLVHDLPAPERARSPWPLGFFPHAVPPPGAPVTVTLDLTRDPLDREFVTIAPGPVDGDLTSSKAAAVLTLPGVPWSSTPPLVVARRGAAATAVLVDFARPRQPGCPSWAPPEDDEAREAVEDWCEVSAWMVGEDSTAPCPLVDRVATPVTVPAVRLRIPAGVLSVAVIVNRRGENYRIWHGLAGPASVTWLTAGEPFWHN